MAGSTPAGVTKCKLTHERDFVGFSFLFIYFFPVYNIFVMEKEFKLVAIGDSYTYINNDLPESGNRVKKGYLTRLIEKLPFKTKLINLGINGAAASNFLDVEIPKGDIYIVLLGTNDWFGSRELGSLSDFKEAKKGTVLGNLGDIIKRIHEVSPNGRIYLCNPVERGRFVYIFDYNNNAHDSSTPNKNGVYLSEFANKILECASFYDFVYPVNLHDETGFKSENAMKFFRIKEDGEIKDLPYPDFLSVHVDSNLKIYPYPIEAYGWAYDGLHPNDGGFEKIADVIFEVIKSTFTY
ncbi:MAG TPA: SGNH/GDSL hydrolase family protein [Firmicutes bacterium]|nr:SGNH/GDSL hydrolase family protein [Bacillota bacterium]HBM70255.1 SGNH/GDSL hydrolase family protein [Bacillota bacterium]